MVNLPQQLSLGVNLNDDATFENFYAPTATHNAMVLQGLRQQVDGSGEAFVYLWGSPGCGLTHLLQAACHQAQRLGLSVQYLPLRDLAGYAPDELFVGLESVDLVCLDCLPAVAGRPDWELAIFNLYNRLRDEGKRLLVAAEYGPRELALTLEDLRSRLQWGLTYQVHSLSDDDKQLALQLRARARGLELSDDVAQYIIQRLPRDTNELFWQLQRLDHASLAEQRKLTIPFVKKVLSI
ncbi:DnaA regulatory inactivator Hda [Cellvibrio sp. KY-YJ-3]|jgi:DnaA family protein|uniref:DnaA regulatory inactivator Hda n=1 Tax=Cellvibrio sp. KY-YJ-3 TaxID=454662 RepID=UPI0012450EC6|nr:DnaA regulatory inactivator Hda [Cellvibrio sp. KY-YJ-3]QEY13544.1 DnaA regulatory inactivator Hda [Cellvibrio sp. KY-YJ-3]